MKTSRSHGKGSTRTSISSHGMAIRRSSDQAHRHSSSNNFHVLLHDWSGGTHENIPEK
jgi:hypothetical protein